MKSAPDILATWNYDAVRERMTIPQPDLPSGMIEVNGDFEYKLGTFNERTHDISFTRQMQEAAAHEPDMILTTMYSAVPVAAAARTFYQYNHQATPYIGGIRADRQASSDHYSKPAFRVVDPLAAIKQESELVRLRRLQEKHAARTAVIIDQFVASGRTISYAAALLRMSGVETVYAIQGRWYEEWQHASSVRPQSHDGFMKCIGRTAAKTV